MDWIKKNILSLIIIVFFILYGLKTCDGGFFGNGVKPKADTVFSSHTEYVPQQPQIIPQYIPMPSNTQAPIFIPQQYKPDTTLNGVLRQYIELLNKYLVKNNYSDSVVLKDSAGHRVGVVNLEDQISENKFTYRKPSYQLSFPVTTNTITITNEAKKRNQIYFGGVIEGSTKNVLNSAGLGLLWKTKRDAVWGITGKYDFYQKDVKYELSRYFKLSFRKQ